METDLFKQEIEDELRNNILKFWMEKMPDGVSGGFYGAIDGAGTLGAQATKGAVLNARILWAFSAAYRVLGDKQYLLFAQRAKEYFMRCFMDQEFGGVYWSLHADGTPCDSKKQIYALGFAIYGLSEYARATGDQETLECAIGLYRDIERHSFDAVNNGYFEAFSQTWTEMDDVRLSNKDANERKTMNTHLHILEPYTNLYRVWPTEELRARIVNLVEIFLAKIYNAQTNHLGLFFSDDWQSRDAGFSYGHDIEASWLLLEAAMEVDDELLIERVKKATVRIADAAMEGLKLDSSMIYERGADGRVDAERHWWVQAECVVGMVWLWRFHHVPMALGRAVDCWNYIKNNLVDRVGGEWWWGVMPDGTKDQAHDKAGFWKCPYHNTRMCLEVLDKIE